MTIGASPETAYIQDDAALVQICHRFREARWLAVDTEFKREKTYFAQLCLIQIATPDLAVCIDALAIENLTPLFALLAQKETVKVFHSCHQDLEILYQISGDLPAPIFDTQLAAPLLGLDPQLGYARLVKEVLDLDLPKTETRSDWSRRPLSDKQLTYALDDVIYLGQIYLKLNVMLDEVGRKAWADEECAGMLSPDRYTQDSDTAWRRIRLRKPLDTTQITVLKTLAGWREDFARSRNIPRNWICRDESLIDLAIQQPDKVEKLDQIQGLKPAFINRNGERIIRLIKESQATAKTDDVQPQHLFNPPLDSSQKKLLSRLGERVGDVAKAHRVPAAFIATRKDLVQLILGSRDSRLLNGWRGSIFCDGLITLIEEANEAQPETRR